MTSKYPSPTTVGRSKSIVFAVVAATLALVVVLAVTLSTGGADEPAEQSAGTAGTATSIPGDQPAAVSAPVETAPVEQRGESLPTFAEGADLAVGRAAPVVTGVGFDGTPVTIGAASDRATLIAFGAHWCPHCQEEFPKLTEWVNTSAYFGGDLQVVAVATATTDERPNYPPSAWLARVGWPGDVLVDDDDRSVAVAYGVSAFPFLVLLDTDGTVLARHAGSGVDFDAFVSVTR